MIANVIKLKTSAYIFCCSFEFKLHTINLYIP